MAFYASMVTFLVTLSLHKFTNIVILIYFEFIQMPIIETKPGVICNLTNLWWKIVILTYFQFIQMPIIETKLGVICILTNLWWKIVILTYFQFIQMPIIETKLGVVCILTNLWWNIVMDDWNLDEKTLSTWHNVQHRKSLMANSFHKRWQILLG